MEVVTKIAPIALALIMLTLGLGLTTSDFTRVIKAPEGGYWYLRSCQFDMSCPELKSEMDQRNLTLNF